MLLYFIIYKLLVLCMHILYIILSIHYICFPNDLSLVGLWRCWSIYYFIIKFILWSRVDAGAFIFILLILFSLYLDFYMLNNKHIKLSKHIIYLSLHIV